MVNPRGECQEVGAMLCAHLAIDGFQVRVLLQAFCCVKASCLQHCCAIVQVEPKYHDPEYSLWRGFWVGVSGFYRFFSLVGLVFFIDCSLVVA